MSDRAAPIILVHGAWGSAASWDAVVPLLRARGHSVIAVDLPSHGKDRTPPGEVGLAEYAAHVAQVLRDHGPALLVGHSMGGMAISAAAELAPDEVRKLAYISAFLPQDGQSLLDLIRQQSSPGLQPAIRRADVPGATVLDPGRTADTLFQDATPAQRTRALAALCPQPNRAQTDRITLSAGRFGTVPRAYIFCEQDRVVTPALQHMMVAASPCAETYSLDSGHVPQLTQPDTLAAILTRL